MKTLKLIMAYWCNYVAARTDDRYEWAYEEAYKIVSAGKGNVPYELLTALAVSAPDEQALAYFAAGPLEDYVNRIVKNAEAYEAKVIHKSDVLKPALEFVWGDIAKLPEVAARSTHLLWEPRPFKCDLQIDLKELAGFWCSVSSSKVAAAYQAERQSLERKLHDDSRRETVARALLLSAPDDHAVNYLKTHVLVG